MRLLSPCEIHVRFATREPEYRLGIAEVTLFEPELWRPNPSRLFWMYVAMPGSQSDYRFGVVRALVGRWEPIFNIPRGTRQKAA